MENEFEREDELEQEIVIEESEGEEDSNEEDEYASLTQEEAIERLRKAEQAIEKSKKFSKKQKKESPTPIKRNINQDDQRFELLELKLELKQEGYPQEAIDFVMEHGGRKVFENPITKKVLEEYKTQTRAEKASDIDSGTKSVVFKKYSESDINNMSAEEMRKALLNQK